MDTKKMSLKQLCGLLKATENKEEVLEITTLIFEKAKETKFNIDEMVSTILHFANKDDPYQIYSLIENLFKLDIHIFTLKDYLEKIRKESRNQKILEKVMEELVNFEPDHHNFGKISFFQDIAIKNNCGKDETSVEAYWTAEKALDHLCNLYKAQTKDTSVQNKVCVYNFLHIHHLGIYKKVKHKAFLFCIKNNLLIESSFSSAYDYGYNFGIPIEADDD